MHAEQSQAMKNITIQVPFDTDGIKRRNTIVNSNSKKFDYKECKKNLGDLDIENRLIEVLKPAVKEHKNKSYHNMLSEVDEMYESLLKEDIFSSSYLETKGGVSKEAKFDNSSAMGVGNQSNAYGQLKYASGSAGYPKGRYW